MSFQEHALPVEKKFFSSGVKILFALTVMGLGVALYRIVGGLGAVTNLDNQYPLGLWIGIDVASGVALAAGGFTTGALVYIFRREYFHAIIRPALLTAMLGYTFVVIGLIFDIGRWYNIWHPAWPTMWQGNSVLFEVGMCVLIYLHVLYLEFLPIVTERFIGRVNLPGMFKRFNNIVDRILRTLDYGLEKTMFIFIIAGVVLSCLHQSSLGTLMVIAPYKLHPLYWSYLSPLFFLASAIAVGYPMVVFESVLSSKSFGRKPEMNILAPLAKYTPYLLGFYIAIRIGDMVFRGTYVHLFEGSTASRVFWVEFGFLTIIPFLLFCSSAVRHSARWLLTASVMYVTGVIFNRCAVFFIAYTPLYAEKAYFPALTEFALTIGLIAALMLVYRAFVTIFPVLPAPGHESN